MTEPTYLIFANIDERFNLRKRTRAAIRRVCQVMCERTDLTAEDVVHYARIGGLPGEDRDGSTVYTFAKNWDKSTYLTALIPALFVDASEFYDYASDGHPILRKSVRVGTDWYECAALADHIDQEEVYAALGFFLSRFGETFHDHAHWLRLSQTLRQLNNQNLTPNGATGAPTP